VIRLLLADDHTLVRDGLRRIVEAHADIRVVAEAGEGSEVLDGLAEHAVDVLVLDISMPGPGLIPLLKRIRAAHPTVRVLVVSMHAEEEWAVRAIQHGAAGYLTKQHSSEELAEAVRRVHAGGKYVTALLAERLASRLQGEGPVNPEEALSKREYEVLRLLGSGLLVKQVAVELGISPRTVSTYRARILEKLGLRNTADLIRYAVERDM
jgi:DNA-binding NarL/FixJ family response regulator